jgi:hypothetical protein
LQSDDRRTDDDAFEQRPQQIEHRRASRGRLRERRGNTEAGAVFALERQVQKTAALPGIRDVVGDPCDERA